ncbi:MAG: acyl--CoA ligase [Actinobacteria bacterium]|nr:acyl--CoA ligase [Actinomycetota bacterium]
MLGRVIDEAAERFGDATAFVSADGSELTFAALAKRSREVAAGMARIGIDEGDVVALALPSLPEYVIAYGAAARIGAITAGVNARLAPGERARVLEQADPRLILATGDLLPSDSVVPTAERIEVEPANQAHEALARLAADEPVHPLPPDPDRPVAIVFTSGTTGTPRGAVFAERQLAFITQVDTGNVWAGRPGTPALAGTSFAHLGPMTKLPGNLMRGSTTHLLDRWRAHDALEMVARHRMPGVGGIPTQIALMLRDLAFDGFDLACVRAIVIGGGPATPALVREARERFGAALSVRYSCTEAGIGVGTAFDAPLEDAELSVGRPHAGVTLTIVDGGDDPLPPGDIGEVCLASPATMTRYWQDDAATARTFTAEGAVRTGDLGWIDDHGRLRLAGRSKEMYVRGGYNVYPVEVEAVLNEHPDIADVAVVARPDDVMGEVGVAVIVVRDGHAPPTADELRTFAAGRLAGYKLPAATATVDALPLTAMEKVDRKALTALVRTVDPA